MPSGECQAGICCTQLNSFIYPLLVVNMSVSITSYLALPLGNRSTQACMCALLANADSSVPSTIQKNSQERPEAYVFVGTGDGRLLVT